MYNSQPLAGAHPRLFFTVDDLTELQAKLQHPDCRGAWSRLLAACEGMLKNEPRALLVRHIRASHLAFAFLMTGREAFAAKAIEMALSIAAKECFISAVEQKRGARTGLGTGNAVTEMCLMYDWLNSLLSQAQKQFLRDAVKTKAMDYAVQDFREQVRGCDWYTCNGINVIHGPLLMAAILFEDEMDTSECYAVALTQTRHAIDAHCPDGGYPEGPLYWNYSQRHMLLGVETLRRLKGINLYHEPFLHNTANYALHTILPWLTQCANTADSFQSTHLWPPVAALAAYHRRPEWQWLARRLITHDWGDDGEGLEYSLFFLIFYNPQLASAPPSDEQTTWLFSGLQQLSLRSDWSEEAIHLLWLNGPSNCHHNHLHLNSFTLSAFGQRLLIEMGKYDYSNNLDYRKHSEGHNTLLVDGQGQIITTDTNIFCRRIRAGQWGTVFGEFRCLREEAGAVIATGSVVNAYAGRLRAFDRTLAFVEKEYVFLHDFIELEQAPPAQLTWLFHSGGELDITNDTALFSAGAAQLQMLWRCAAALNISRRGDHSELDGDGRAVPYLVIDATCTARTLDFYALLIPHRVHAQPDIDITVVTNVARNEPEVHFSCKGISRIYHPRRRALQLLR